MRKVSMALLLVSLVVGGPAFSGAVLAAEPAKSQKAGSGATKATPPAESGAASTAAAGPLQVNDALPPPAGFVQASQCVARNGIHYVGEGTSALPPILAYDESGKLVSIEYIVAQRQLERGLSWRELPGVAGRPVDHINIDFYPTGPRGGGLPHYTVHLYFISSEAQQRICPDSTAREPVSRSTRKQ